MRLGDAANFFVLINTGAFVACVLLDTFGLVHLMSDSFRRDGFCVSNPDSKTFNSHIMCFYGDTATALFFALFVRRHSKTAGIKGSAVEMGAAGIFGHGAAHLGLSFAGQNAGPARLMEVGIAGMLTLRNLSVLIGLAAFFFLLLRSGPNIRHAPAHSLMHAVILWSLVPPKFGFTYVQTALLWLAAAYDVRRPHKDVFYDLNALLISVPVSDPDPNPNPNLPNPCTSTTRIVSIYLPERPEP